MQREERRASRAGLRGSQLILIVECDSAEEEADDKEQTVQGEIMAPVLPSPLLRKRESQN